MAKRQRKEAAALPSKHHMNRTMRDLGRLIRAEGIRHFARRVEVPHTTAYKWAYCTGLDKLSAAAFITIHEAFGSTVRSDKRPRKWTDRRQVKKSRSPKQTPNPTGSVA